MVTAPIPNTVWGWAIVTHPFHPLRGRKLRVIRQRTFGRIVRLTLELEVGKGTVVVPREWTDQEPPSLETVNGGVSTLDYGALILLLQVVNRLRKSPTENISCKEV